VKAQRRWLGFIIAMVALAVTITAYASAGEQDAQGGEANAQAGKVEAELARTGLLGRLRQTLGDGFGGLWFDQPTAQLHVGVTSPDSREAAEEIAAAWGLAANVTETPVRSTWDELLAAQEEWGDRMADLFARAEVSTALRAQYNAVEVQLGSAVPPSRRSELDRAAEASAVNVSITTAQVPHIRIAGQAKTCRVFEKEKAYCDPTITAGVRIENENGASCTAGPAVLPDAHVTTNTYILTSGHCIDKGSGGEGIGGKWFAFPKNAKEKAERVEIGKSVEFINNTAVDIGVIKVENAFWMNKGFTPVEPAVALWPPAEESEPKEITAQRVPAENMKVCVSAQTSGKVCGKILKLSVHAAGNEGLVEVNAVTKPGDSGAPWYPEEALSTMIGTHDGENVATGKAVFEPLETSFKKLAAEKLLKLKLLTEKNKKRHNC